MKYIFIFAVGLLIYSFSNNRGDQKSSLNSNTDKFFDIKYEKLLENKQVVGLSQVASKVEYVKLETTNDCVIGQGAAYFFTDSLIFVSNRNHVLKFSHRGKFLQRIGEHGLGPEEIDVIVSMSLIPDKKLIVVQKDVPKKLLYFTFDGKFVKDVSIPRFESLKVLSDERYIAYNSGNTGIDEYCFQLTNSNKDALAFVKNNDKWRTTAPSTFMIDYPYFEPFYQFRNRYCLKSVYNDTVYYISGSKIIPGYSIDLGKYKIPLELRPEKVWMTDNADKELFRKKRNEYYYCNVSEASDKIFLTTSNFSNKDIKFFLIDKKNESGNLLINEERKSTGFVDDWDGGIDFWPKGNVNDNKVFMPIDMVYFKKTLKENNEKNGSIKYPEKQSQLQKIIADSDITDNPILMVVTLKKP